MYHTIIIKNLMLFIFSLFLTIPIAAWAALRLDVSQETPQFLLKFLQPSNSFVACSKERQSCDALQEKNRNEDFNHVTHIRAQQLFAGFPVWGADIIVHIPDTNKNSKTRAISLAELNHQSAFTMNGVLYRHLYADLKNASSIIFQTAQQDRALTIAINDFLHKNAGQIDIDNKNVATIIFVDQQQKAHFAYHITFHIAGKFGIKPSLPNYIIDASSLTVYKTWNEIKTFDQAVSAGGYGGNLRTGKLIYDGAKEHLPLFKIQRDAEKQICYWQADQVVVRTFASNAIAQFKCVAPDPTHSNVYWDDVGDPVNGGYSPNHDAFFVATMTKAMFATWYHLPLLAHNGVPSIVTAITHAQNVGEGKNVGLDYAYYDGTIPGIVFGDGHTKFYPLPSIDVGAHELSHGFTEQHSALLYDEQSGGLNESFADMTAKAVEYFAFGKNRWDLGSDILKAKGKALRYMDKPSKDCEDTDDILGCSIDDASQYHHFLDMHQISGVFNRAFYLIATSSGWDTKKIYDVMVKANTDYWVANSTFDEAACGVLKAAADYHYETSAIYQAFATVKVNTAQC